MGAIGETLLTFWDSTGIANFSYQNGIMIVVALFFLYLAIRHGFEPLLLVPIAFGMLLSNLPLTGIFLNDIVHEGISNSNELSDAGIFSIFYVLKPVLPSLIFLGVGAMTDFGPLIANPKSLLMGAAAQLGIFFAFFAAIVLGFTAQEAGSIAIIGGADGPTAIYLTTKLADHLVGPIAVAAYSYMALVPIIQPPIMKMLTTEKERQIKMEQLRTVSQRGKNCSSVRYFIKCTFKHPGNTSGNMRWCISYWRHIPHLGDDQDRNPRRTGILFRYSRRRTHRQADECSFQDSDQPSYRFRRCICSTDGG